MRIHWLTSYRTFILYMRVDWLTSYRTDMIVDWNYFPWKFLHKLRDRGTKRRNRLCRAKLGNSWGAPQMGFGAKPRENFDFHTLNPLKWPLQDIYKSITIFFEGQRKKYHENIRFIRISDPQKIIMRISGLSWISENWEPCSFTLCHFSQFSVKNSCFWRWD